MDSIAEVLLSSSPLAWLGAFGVAAAARPARLAQLPLWACATASVWTMVALGGVFASLEASNTGSVTVAWFTWLDGPNPPWPRLAFELQADRTGIAFGIAQSVALLLAVRGVSRMGDVERGAACAAVAMAAFAGLWAILAGNLLGLAIGWHLSALAVWRAGRPETEPPREGLLDLFLLVAILVADEASPLSQLPSDGPPASVSGWRASLMAALIVLSVASRWRAVPWLRFVPADTRSNRLSGCLRSAVLWPAAGALLLRFAPLRYGSLTVATAAGVLGIATALPAARLAVRSDGARRLLYAAASGHGMVLALVGAGDATLRVAATSLAAALPIVTTAARSLRGDSAPGEDDLIARPVRWWDGALMRPMGWASAIVGFLDRQVVCRLLPASLRAGLRGLSAVHATLETDSASLPLVAALLASGVLALALLM